MASPATNLTDAAAAIRALEVDFERHATARDAGKLVEAFYSDNATLLPPNAPQVNGRAAIHEFWQAFLAADPTGISLETGDVAASGDLAYGTGKYGFSVGGVRQEGKYLVVYLRQADGSYKAVADMFSPNA